MLLSMMSCHCAEAEQYSISEPLFLFLRRTSDCCAHMFSSCFLVTSYLLFPLLFLSGPASLKMKHRLPSSGTSTIFMLSQTTSTHSFSWSDWGLSFFSSCPLLPQSLCVCQSCLCPTCCVFPPPLLPLHLKRPVVALRLSFPLPTRSPC